MRLMIIYAVVSAAALGLVLSQVVRTYASHAKSITISDLGDEVPRFSQAANLRPASETLYDFAKSYLASHVSANQHILLIDIFGQGVLGSVGSSKVIGLKSVASFIRKPPSATTFTTVDLGSVPYLVMGSPIDMNGKVVGSFVGTVSLADLQSQESQVILLAGMEALVALVFSVAAGYFLLKRVMNAVGRITETAVEISRGDLDRRLDYVGQSDEVGKLAMAFDGMISRISQTMDSQRRLLADVSHQLKTPLTVIRGNLELITRAKKLDKAEVDEVIGVVISEADYMKSMLEGLLLLERMTDANSLDESTVDLRSFVSDVFTSALVLGPRNWHLGDVPDLWIKVDAPKLRGAVLNLLDNAEKATDEGELISLSVFRNEGWLDVCVSDNGSGIEPHYLETIFERFERGVSKDQRGAGLGLAIVKAVVTAHGGVIKVDSKVAEGTTFTLRLPSERVIGEK